VGLEQT
jgi:hypothetical protein